jgi:hypothetical protein
MDDNYFFWALIKTPFIIIGGALAFLAPFLFGQILFLVSQSFFNHEGLDLSPGGIVHLVFYIIFALGFGSISGIGLIFLGLDIWAGYRVVVLDKPKHDSFYIIAANQIALSLCAILAYGGFYDSVPGALVAFAILGGMFGITKPIMIVRERRRHREMEAETESLRVAARAASQARFKR